MIRNFPLLGLAMLLVTLPMGLARAQKTPDASAVNSTGPQTIILPPDSLFSAPVGGLERTDATQQTVTVVGQPFTRALRVTLKKDATETNATQLTINSVAPIQKGEALIARFAVRGTKATGNAPAQLMFLFEKSTDPWTKSVSSLITAPRDGTSWRRVSVPFVAAESYSAGEVMASLRFAFGPQTIEVADLNIVSLGMNHTGDELLRLAADANPLGTATVTLDLKDRRQTMLGFGGNFCQPRYGGTEKMDAVGQYNLDNLKVAVARVGLPLDYWTPEKGVYREDGQAGAALQLMQIMARRKIPIIATVWEGPQWLLPGPREGMGRVLAPDKYEDCIEAIVRFLVTARDKYSTTVDYFSFNEADYGVNFRFTPETIAAFMKKAIPRFAAAGLRTRFLVADTANGSALAGYAEPLLNDATLAPHLGPIAFHSWDALEANETAYTAIANLSQKYNKPVWCTEAGHDAQLWQKPNPWGSWENALRLTAAYVRTLRLSHASTMLYWTYQDNYPLVSQDGKKPFPAFQAVTLLQNAFPKGATVCGATADTESIMAVAVVPPEGKGVKVILVNLSGAGTVTVKGIPGGKRATYTTLKSDDDKSAAVAITVKRSNVVLNVPALSVTLLTIE